MFTLRGRVEPITLTVTQTLWCPLHRKEVGARCRVAPWDNRLLDVESCSGNVSSAEVTCGKACLSARGERPS